MIQSHNVLPTAIVKEDCRFTAYFSKEYLAKAVFTKIM